jgi:cyclase
MLAKRVIPTMLVRGTTLVKGKVFAGDRSVGHALQAARVHARRGVDELLILDIGATPDGRGPDLELVSALAAECYIPITIGGGVRNIEDVDALLRAGADKVAIGAAARAWGTTVVAQAADRFGSQAIVVIIENDGDAALAARDCAVAQAMGAGEIVLQSRPRDGTLLGYDLDVIRVAASGLTVPLIASGGCSGPEDMAAAFAAGADACAAGALYQFTDCTPRDCVRFLAGRGLEVRL